MDIHAQIDILASRLERLKLAIPREFENKRFKHPETGNQVLFQSLPSYEQSRYLKNLSKEKEVDSAEVIDEYYQKQYKDTPLDQLKDVDITSPSNDRADYYKKKRKIELLGPDHPEVKKLNELQNKQKEEQQAQAEIRKKRNVIDRMTLKDLEDVDTQQKPKTQEDTWKQERKKYLLQEESERKQRERYIQNKRERERQEEEERSKPKSLWQYLFRAASLQETLQEIHEIYNVTSPQKDFVSKRGALLRR